MVIDKYLSILSVVVRDGGGLLLGGVVAGQLLRQLMNEVKVDA